MSERPRYKIKYPDIEREVVGELLLGNREKLIEAQDSGLTKEAFTDPILLKAYGAIEELSDLGVSISPISVEAHFREGEDIDSKSLSALTNLYNNAGNAGDFSDLCTKLIDAYNRRSFPKRVEGILSSFDPRVHSLSDFEDQIKAVFQVGSGGLKPILLEDLAEPLSKALTQEATEGPAIISGLNDLDKKLKIRKGTLTIIGARPGKGKTALATNIVVKNSQNGKKGALFTLEVSDEDMAQRVLSQLSRIPLKDLVSEHQKWTPSKIKNYFQGLGLYIYDTTSPRIETIQRTANIQKTRHGLDYVLIDYVGLMSFDDAKLRHEGIGQISQKLKQLSKELSVPVIALVQLARDVENNKYEIPKLSNIRDSGSIEQDADNTLFLFTTPKDKKSSLSDFDENVDLITIRIAKQRRGGKDIDIDTVFLKDIGLFTDRAPEKDYTSYKTFNKPQDAY